MNRASPAAITAVGSAAAATVAWRRGPQLFVTVVVKAAFALVPSRAMTLLAPEPIFFEEQEGAPGQGPRSADDLAPYLRQTDVCLTGHTAAPRPPGAPSVSVRLALFREKVVLVDKSLDFEVPRGPAPRPVPLAGMGPVSKHWPIRRRLLDAVDPRCLEGPVLEIPESFDWRYFQAAPGDQQTGSLRGDEWLFLEGVHPTPERFMTQLPGARGVARIRRRPTDREGGEPLDLTLDTLRIDADRRCCTLSWRGHFPVAQELSSIHVLAGVELPGHALQWPAFPAHAPPPSPVIQARADEDPLAGTIMMSPGALAGTVEESSDDPLAGTLYLREDTAAELAAAPATPFRSDFSPSSMVSTPARAAPAPSDEDSLGSTMGISELTAAALAVKPATPFQQGRAPTAPFLAKAEEDPLAGTLGLREDAAALLAARPATPFRTDITSPLSIPAVPSTPAPAAKHDPLGETLGLQHPMAIELAIRPATPFQKRNVPPLLKPSVAPLVGEEEMPAELGAQFLFAMAAISRTVQPL